MFSKTITSLLLVALLAALAESKVYSKCEFAQQMKKNGISGRSKLGTWTCIAYNESRFNTKAINNDSGDYGILQISHLYWCSDTNKPGKGCNLTCKSLLGDNITSSIVCAKKIYAEFQQTKGNGFEAWVAYGKCHGDQTHWLDGCKL